jgi:hypothetical protein
VIADLEGPSFISRTVAHRRTHDGARDTRPSTDVCPVTFYGDLPPGFCILI